MDYEQLYPGFEQAFDVGFDQDGVFHMLTNSPDGRVQIEITMHPRLAEKLGAFLADHSKTSPQSHGDAENSRTS